MKLPGSDWRAELPDTGAPPSASTTREYRFSPTSAWVYVIEAIGATCLVAAAVGPWMGADFIVVVLAAVVSLQCFLSAFLMQVLLDIRWLLQERK